VVCDFKIAFICLFVHFFSSIFLKLGQKRGLQVDD